MFFERRIRFPADFPMLGEVGDIVPMDSRDFRYQYSPLRLLLFGINRSTLPKELVGPLWFCQNEGIPLTFDSLLFDYALIKCFFVTDNST